MAEARAVRSAAMSATALRMQASAWYWRTMAGGEERARDRLVLLEEERGLGTRRETRGEGVELDHLVGVAPQDGPNLILDPLGEALVVDEGGAGAASAADDTDVAAGGCFVVCAERHDAALDEPHGLEREA